MVTDKVPILREIESFRAEFVNGRTNTLRTYQIVEVANSISNKLSVLEKRLEAKTT